MAVNQTIEYKGVKFNLADPTQFKAYQTMINNGQTPVQASPQSTQNLINTYNQGGGQPLSTQQIGTAISQNGSATPSIQGGLDASSSPTNLVSFKNALGGVIDLARQKRNTNMQAFMGTPGFQGTLMASDFNTLFSQMNRQGDNYGEMQAEKLLKEDTSKYQTVTKEDASGKVTAVTFDPTTGQTISTVDLGSIGTPSAAKVSGTDKKYTSGGLTYTQADLGEGQQKLDESRGSDGYVDPSIYQAMYQEWINNGGLVQDFVSKYPPKNFVNPANTWLPSFLRPPKPADSWETDLLNALGE